MHTGHRPPKGRVQVKIAKPTGKEDELRMPADEFDRVMGQVLGADVPHKPGSGLRDNRNRERTPPIIQETERGPAHPDRPLGAPAGKPEEVEPKPAKK